MGSFFRRDGAVAIRLAFAVWLAFVIAVSVLPLPFKSMLHTNGRLHSSGHFVVYAITGIFLWLIAEQWLTRLFGFAFGLALLLSQEWAENQLYHAGFEWKDVKTDFVGLVTGFALMLLFAGLLNDNATQRSRSRF